MPPGSKNQAGQSFSGDEDDGVAVSEVASMGMRSPVVDGVVHPA